jgi:hypothetical protein
MARVREEIGAPPVASERAENERNAVAARAALGEARFQSACREGRGMTLEQAIALALDPD